MSRKTALSRDRIERALRLCKGTRDAAAMLSCHPQTLSTRLKQEGMTPPWSKGTPTTGSVT